MTSHAGNQARRKCPNTALAGLLAELGWSPRTLARRLNATFGVGTIADSAPYHWRDTGRVPRAPIPTLVAAVLSAELGRRVTVDELWQGCAVASPRIVPATADMDTAWSRDGTLAVVNDWVVSGMLDRRQFLAVSGTSLTAFATGYLRSDAHSAPSLPGKISEGPLVDQIEQSIPLLQQLDDARGGGTHLDYVGANFRAVALLLRQGGHPARVETRLFAALATIGQLAGWMAFDAGRHGLAQRYFFTALRCARESGYQSMAAHIMADLAFQTATLEHAADAIALGETATELADRAPAGVQASVRTRLAYGYAIAGRLDPFERSYQQAIDCLHGDRNGHEPDWLYFLTPNHLDTQAGYALAHAGTLALDAGNQSTARNLLRRGETLLRTGAHDRPLIEPQQRRALFEGAWLATAAAAQGKLEDACSVGRTAIERTTTVRSARSIDVLQRLATRLRRAQRNEYVRGFLPDLDTALTRAAAALS
jgi:hypothetical protein